MKLKTYFLLLAAAAAATLLPHSAFADSVTITLNAPVQSVTTSGGLLSFSGTVKNTSTSTEYFTGDSLSLALNPQYYTFSDDGFFGNLFQLDAGQSYVGDLFTILLNSGTPAGNYVGTYRLLASTDPNDTTGAQVGSATLQANVNAPATAVTPEPSSLLLLGTGALSAFGIMRRRLAL